MKPRPLVAVRDVEASRRWYQGLIGVRGGHGGAEYAQPVDGRSGLILPRHAWDAHDHPPLGEPAGRPCGYVVVLAGASGEL